MDLGREDCLDKSRVSVQKRSGENSEHLEFPTPKSCVCDFAYEHVKVNASFRHYTTVDPGFAVIFVLNSP